MHPLATLIMTEVHQQERLQEAELMRRPRVSGRRARRSRRSARERLGYLLVHVGLRLAVAPRPAVSR
jgi:hypothetical protein